MISRRLVRFALGSGAATLASAATFAVVYHVSAGPRLSTVAAFLVGALVNFTAGRFWVWRRRPGSGLRRDALRFGVVAVAAALTALAATSATHAALAGADPAWRAVLVEASYLGTYAALFGVKFLVLDRVVFRSRHQVPNTTRV